MKTATTTRAALINANGSLAVTALRLGNLRLLDAEQAVREHFTCADITALANEYGWTTRRMMALHAVIAR